MQHDPRAHLADVIEAAESIRAFTAGVSFERYRVDDLVQSAVERQFEIIGEALNRLRRDDPAVAARVPDVDRIVGFRNVLIHGYDIVDHEAVWDAITKELPTLLESARIVLRDLDQTLG